MENERTTTKTIAAKKNAGYPHNNKPGGDSLAAYQKSLENISPYFSKNPTINFSDKIVVASKIVT